MQGEEARKLYKSTLEPPAALSSFRVGIQRSWKGLSSYLVAQGLSKSVISRVIIGVTPFRVLITLLITHLLSPLGLLIGIRACILR